VIAVAAMMLFAGPVSGFVERHPSIKMLALAFLLLIGVLLVAEGMGAHLDRGYVYFAMGFSLFVEMLNLRAQSRGCRRREPGRARRGRSTFSAPTFAPMAGPERKRNVPYVLPKRRRRGQPACAGSAAPVPAPVRRRGSIAPTSRLTCEPRQETSR